MGPIAASVRSYVDEQAVHNLNGQPAWISNHYVRGAGTRNRNIHVVTVRQRNSTTMVASRMGPTVASVRSYAGEQAARHLQCSPPV